VKRTAFGETADGTAVWKHTLTNARGASISFLSYGGTITQIMMPDSQGRLGNVVLACGSIADYERNTAYLGALIGRYANRIAGGAFPLEGRPITINANEGENTLHGGQRGFDRRHWAVDAQGASATLTYTSADGEEGFPGTLKASVTYTLDDENAFTIAYRATTDRPTVVNLTCHPYFNRGGEGAGSIENHVLSINADDYLPIGPGSIPTGAIEPVAGTPLDFRQPTAIGARLRSSHPQMILGHGYDHAYAIKRDGGGLALHARVSDPISGRGLEIRSDQPSVQFYSGNHLDGTIIGTSGRQYRQSDGFCLETQHFPDSPNRPAFPTTVLLPGATYRTTTKHTFTVAAG
jgi:aldose 1-epimerase